MPLDPSLPLQVRPSGFDPGRIMSEAVVGFQKGKALDQEQAIQARNLKDQNTIREILTKTGGNLEAAVPEVMAINPEMGMKLQQNVAQTARATAEQRAAELDLAGKKLRYASPLLSTTTAETFDMTKKVVTELFGADIAANLGNSYEEFEPKKAGLIKWGMTAAEQLKAEHDELMATLTRQRDEKAAADKADDNKRMAAKDAKDAADKEADNKRQAARDKAEQEHWQRQDRTAADNSERYRREGKPAGDVFWDRDREEYKDYVANATRANEDAQVEPFSTWRMREKQRGSVSMAPAARPVVNPNYGKGKPAAAPTPAAAAPAPARDPKQLVGKTVRLKDGSTRKVKAVNPDGTLVFE